MKRYRDITGVILAGGKNSRMGSDKAMLLFEGKPFIQHIAETLGTVFDQTIIISDHRDQYSFLDLPVHTDIIKSCGPLGGIHAGLVNARTEDVFVVPCDLPFIRPAVIRYIIRHAGSSDVAIMKTGDQIQPLCGLYRSTCILPISINSTRGRYSLQTLLNQVAAAILEPDAALRPMVHHAFLNINTPDDSRANFAFSV